MEELNVFLDTNKFIFLYTVIRLILGILLFFQAYDKIFKIKLNHVISEITHGDKSSHVHPTITKLSVYTSSYIELIGGIGLILGIFTTPLLCLIGLHLMVVCFAFSFLDPVWDTKLVFSRLILLAYLILNPIHFNIVSLDYLIF